MVLVCSCAVLRLREDLEKSTSRFEVIATRGFVMTAPRKERR
ncbi:hypothetical protein ACP70R_000436 [Stipagrostis hirtigluma subsp. patula]